MKPNIAQKISDFFVSYFSLNGYLVDQETAEANIREGVSFRGTNILILIIAIFIASLGLNTNSTAVIIGAMLISPLMGPIIGVGLGVGIHDFELIKRCVRNLLMAAGFSVITACVYFLISPVNEQHSELLARTSPTIYDVLIGFFGGGAGIIALGSTNKGNVIPGVAIATALMPPLCTAGYGLATWQPAYFLGATYLFIINSIYIAFATFIGVKLMKYKAKGSADPDRARKIRRIVYSLAILTMLPSIYLTYRMIEADKYKRHIDRFVSTECNFPETQVLGQRIETSHGEHTLVLTLIGRPLPTDSLRLALTSRLQYYDLKNTRIELFQGGETTPANYSAPTLDEVYRLAQASINQKQATIDSLMAVLAADRTNAEAASTVSPEIRVLFPNIRKIGIITAYVANQEDSACVDTVNLALVNVGRRFENSEREMLSRYIEARLHLTNVRIVELPE